MTRKQREMTKELREEARRLHDSDDSGKLRLQDKRSTRRDEGEDATEEIHDGDKDVNNTVNKFVKRKTSTVCYTHHIFSVNNHQLRNHEKQKTIEYMVFQRGLIVE